MIASSSFSATTSATTSGVKRKASPDMSDDIWTVTPRKNHLHVATTGTPSTIRSRDSEFFSDLSDNCIATSDTSGERIESCNSYAVNIGDSRVNVSSSRQRPTTELYIKMVVGPKVNIVVGPEKKSFELPKDLLAYYSPVFDRSFNGNFIEGQTQNNGIARIYCERFRSSGRYADKYDLGDVSTLVYDALRTTLIEGGASAFEPSFIKSQDGNCLRALMVDGRTVIPRGYFGKNIQTISDQFRKAEAEVEGFTSALYCQLKKSVSCSYRAPFYYRKKHKDFD
ncbi:uncharacterized protein EAF02_007938 [Botrytis sinoallii]|uniref:uncharacterized protein n=1 Tax=Botrytis sinoallii TaxID=1463999 RepID=UPI0019027784|nr:uncharacterized protein EAF02_007938 [Botrytis sinoallii]KAF7879768.1 hypothetical protein EAF02_007938 [Botrytis sinoallii]